MGGKDISVLENVTRNLWIYVTQKEEKRRLFSCEAEKAIFCVGGK